MPRLKHTLPRYRKHKASGQAVVSLDGNDCSLGPHGTEASKAEEKVRARACDATPSSGRP